VTELLAPPVSDSAALPETPYVGLVPYTEDDSAFFFGREAEKAIVTANVRANRLTLLYGPSGVGKTSLLLAGVVHDLRARVARSAAAGSGRAQFAVAVFRGWRDDPLPLLMEEIRLSVEQALGGAKVDPWRPGEPVVDTLRGWTERARTLLVVLDQFEDYFLYHPSETGNETFDAQFPAIVNDPNLRVNFLVSIREDAWAKLDRFEGRIPQLFANYVRIEHLDRAGARDAVERPIAEFNRRLPPDEEAYEIEPALVDAVVQAASTGGSGIDEGANGDAPAGGGDEVEAPFLQLVMERLWRATVEDGERELTLATLVRLGGAQEIVERHLVDALAGLSPREQEIAADAFRYLVTSSRRKVVQSASDLSEWLRIPEAELVPVLERLSSGESGRILRPVPPPPGSESEGQRYEIFHDVLGEPILEWRKEFERTREAEAEARRQRAVRRRLVAIVAGLIVLVLCFAAFAAWALHERRVAKDHAETTESQELAARALGVQGLDPKQTLVLASQAEDVKSTPQADEALRRALVGWPKPVVLVPPGRTTYGVDFSPDGRFVAVAGGGGSRVLTVTGRPVATLEPTKLVYSARFSSDGKHVVTAGADGSVRVWRVGDWRPLPVRLRVRAHLLARAAFTADGRFIVAGGYPGWGNSVWRFGDGRVGPRVTRRDRLGGWIEPDGTARVVDAVTAASAAQLANDTGTMYTFATGRTGGLSVAAGAYDDYTPVYRTRKPRTPQTKLPYADAAAVSPDGNRVAIEGYNGTEIWDLLEEVPEIILRRYAATTSFSLDGRLAASPSWGADVTRVWNSRTGAVLAELPPRPPRFDKPVSLPDPYPVSGGGGGSYGSTGPPALARGGSPPAFELQPRAAFSPDGGLVTTWGRDIGGAQLWSPFGLRQLAILRKGYSQGDVGLTLPIALSPDGGLVAAADRDNVIRVWRTRDGRPLEPMRGSKQFVSALAFSPNGDRVAASSHDGFVRLWRVSDGHLLLERRGGGERVGAVAIDPKATLLASGNEDGTVQVWRVADGKLEWVLPKPAGAVTSVAFSSDGDSLVAGARGGTARVWSTGDWKERAVLGPTRSHALVEQALLSKDGSRVVTLDMNAVARLWRGDGGPPLRTYKKIATIALSADGTQFLAGGGDATVRILKTSDGKEVGLLRGHTDVVNDARFGPDGDLIVTAGGSEDKRIRVWQAATNGPVAVFTPSAHPVLRAMLGADGRLVTVSEDGVRLYACEPCLRPDRLRELAKERLAAR
jgi:WD40 repeat protein